MVIGDTVYGDRVVMGMGVTGMGMRMEVIGMGTISRLHTH